MTVVALPDARHEHWKYTRLTPLEQTPAQVSPCNLAGPQWAVDLVATADYVFRFDGVAWQLPSDLPATVTVEHLEGSALAVNGSDALLAKAENAPCLQVSVAANQQLRLAVVTEADAQICSQSHFRLLVGQSAEVALVDCALTGERGVQNKSLVVELAANARCRHLQLSVGCLDGKDGDASKTSSVKTGSVYTHQQIDIARDAAYGRWEIAFDGLLQRSSAAVNLTDKNAYCQLHGALMPFAKSHFDTHFWINHLAERCNSLVGYRALADQRGRAVFNGMVHVARGAQLTDSEMQIKSLMLSPHAEIDAKPELEIYADDVKCGHGSTIGEIDPQALFYLRSRGIDAETAKAMMTYAFAAEVVETLEDQLWKPILSAELRARFNMLEAEE